MPDQSQVSRDGDCALVVTRQFDAPRTLVWRAFTEPPILTRWLLGPPGWEMHVCEVNVRPGGTYHWRWRNPETGDAFGFRGTYSDVRANRLLVDTQTFEQGEHATPMGEPTQNRVTFEDAPGGTRVVTHITYPDAATLEMVLSQGMSDGMEMSYARLDGILPDVQ